MAGKVDVPLKTAMAGEDLIQHRLVRYNSSGAWVYADAGEMPVGPVRALVANTKPVAAELAQNKPGTIKCVASAAISSLFQRVYSAADGKISTTNTGVLLGINMNTASGDGSVVEVLPMIRRVPMVNVAASALIGATSTAEADFDKTFDIPAAELVAGSIIRVKAAGLVVNQDSTPQLDIRLYAGTEVIATITVAAAATNDQFVIDAEIVIRTIGSSGTLVAMVRGVCDAAGSSVVTANKAQVTEDTTGGLTIKVSGQFNASHASNTVRLDILEVEHVR